MFFDSNQRETIINELAGMYGKPRAACVQNETRMFKNLVDLIAKLNNTEYVQTVMVISGYCMGFNSDQVLTLELNGGKVYPNLNTGGIPYFFSGLVFDKIDTSLLTVPANTIDGMFECEIFYFNW